MRMMKKNGQVWVETVIYILIGLALIGLVLAFVMPKINEQRDRIVVEQTLVSLSALDSKIREVIVGGNGNKRIIDFSMKRGTISIDPIQNKITFVLDGMTKPYSEPDIDIPVGRIKVRTTEGVKTSSVDLTVEYGPGSDIVFEGGNLEIKRLNPSPTPYRISIENKGQIDITILS